MQKTNLSRLASYATGSEPIDGVWITSNIILLKVSVFLKNLALIVIDLY